MDNKLMILSPTKNELNDNEDTEPKNIAEININTKICPDHNNAQEAKDS